VGLLSVNTHLDSFTDEHHDAEMRTTITLEKDVERMLRDAMHQSRKSFKETLNAAVRAGLDAKQVKTRAPKFTIKARPLGLRSGIDPAGFNKLADDQEVDAFLEKNSRMRKKGR
jgi:hypothetical protein